MCHKSRTRFVYPSHTQQFSHEIYKFAVFSCYHYSLFYFKQVCTNRCVHTIFICRLSLFIVCYFSYQDLILSLDLCTNCYSCFTIPKHVVCILTMVVTANQYVYIKCYLTQSVSRLPFSWCLWCTTVCCTITIVFVWLLPSGTTASEVRYYYSIGC